MGMNDETVLKKFHKRLDTLYGSILRPVWHQDSTGMICPVCYGIKQPEFDLCYQCSRTQHDAQHESCSLADVVRIGYYAIEFDDQFYKIMRSYKTGGNEAAYKAVQYLLVDALVAHRDSLVDYAGPVTCWAYVPSSKSSIDRYGKQHPLESILLTLFQDVPQIRLASQCEKARNFNPQAFTLIPDNSIDLSHVLLLDDSWTTGNSIQSAASVLKQAGAERVTVYCLARIINKQFLTRNIGAQKAEKFLKTGLSRPHDPWYQSESLPH